MLSLTKWCRVFRFVLVVGATEILELEEVKMITISQIITIFISLCALLFSVYMGVRGNKKTDTKEIEARVERETRLDMKLAEIGNDVKDVKETVKTIQNDVKDHEGRIAKLEASYRRLHERVDNFPHSER